MSTATIDVACFGELLWDFFEAEAKTEKEPIARQFRRELGGSTANVAVALARLGMKVSAIGGVGEDKLGSALELLLAAEGVDTGSVVKIDGASTGITFVTHNATGDATFIPYRGGTADLRFSDDDVTASMGKVRYAIVSTTSMLPTARAATEKFLAAVEKAKGIIVVDLNVRAHLWTDADEMRTAVKDLVARAALIKASDRDLNPVAGKRGMSWLDEHAKHATWLLTRGENGAAAVGVHGQATAPTKRVRCIDRTGGGDAFTAGAVAVLARANAKPTGAEWKDSKLWTRALEVGHLLAAKAVAALGATTGLVSLDDVKGRLAAPKK